MKINEIITESQTDLVGRHHIDISGDTDRRYNPEADHYAKETREYYKKYHSGSNTPVYEKETNFSDPKEIDWTNKPGEGVRQSPGYRGQEYAKERAGIPHDKDVQGYNPRYFKSTDENGFG